MIYECKGVICRISTGANKNDAFQHRFLFSSCKIAFREKDTGFTGKT